MAARGLIKQWLNRYVM